MDHSAKSGENVSLGTAFKTGIALNAIFIVIEVFYGLKANSMALVSDAGHNLSDVIVLVFSWAAVSLARQKPTMKFTYGFRRSTILAALFNTMILLAAVILIFVAAVERLRNPLNINANIVIIVASAGIIVNGLTAWLFMKNQRRDLNIRSAFIHFIADALVSLGVVVSGVIISFTKFAWIDSLVSMVIAGVIIYSTVSLLIRSVNLALDAVPENIDIAMVSDYLNSLHEVTAIHDLHIWAMSTTEAAITVHLITNRSTDAGFVHEVQHQLKEKFGLGHSTIQIEFGDNPEGCNNCN